MGGTILKGRKTFHPFGSNVPVVKKPGKMCEKHLWKSGSLIKDAGNCPISLSKMLHFRRCFSSFLLVQTGYLVSPLVENWPQMDKITNSLSFVSTNSY